MSLLEQDHQERASVREPYKMYEMYKMFEMYEMYEIYKMYKNTAIYKNKTQLEFEFNLRCHESR